MLLHEDNVSPLYTVCEDIQLLHFLLRAQICTLFSGHQLESNERREVIITAKIKASCTSLSLETQGFHAQLIPRGWQRPQKAYEISKS